MRDSVSLGQKIEEEERDRMRITFCINKTYCFQSHTS